MWRNKITHSNVVFTEGEIVQHPCIGGQYFMSCHVMQVDFLQETLRHTFTISTRTDNTFTNTTLTVVCMINTTVTIILFPSTCRKLGQIGMSSPKM